MSSPFVGRRHELESIRAVQLRARGDRSPGAVYITGDPGSGKSRLLAEIITQADAARCVRIVGFEPTQPVPLAAVGELLRRLAKVPGHGAMLDALVFGGHRSPASDSLRIFEAAHRALTEFGSLLLIIDDLQWVDERSIALIHYLMRSATAAPHPLVVVVASRPAPAAASFRAGLEAELPPERLATIELGPMPLADALSFVHAIDRGLDDAAATLLWRRAAGSPFWMLALAQAKGAADPGNVISERLRSLSNDASAMLATLAVGARPFLLVDLGELHQWEPERVRHSARELVARGLAVEASGGITVAHDLIREAASGTIPLTTRRPLHARLAEQIERSAGGDLRLLAEALDHRAAAGLTTVELATRIVASPQRRLLGAEDLLRLSSIADALPPGSPKQIDLDEGLARLATELGERERAIRHWDRVAGAAQEPRLRQRAHVEAARVGYEGAFLFDLAGNPQDVHRHLAEARSLPVDAVTGMELDAIEAQVRLWDEHDTTGGAAAAARALARGRELLATAGGARRLAPETRAAVLAAFVAAGEAAVQEERPDEMIEIGAEVLTVADALGEEARLEALLHVAFAFHRLGRLFEAEERYRKAWETSRRLMLPRSMVEAAIYLAQVLHDLGRLAEAQAMAREADALQARIRPWLWGEMSKTVLHLIELSLGETSAVERIRADIAELDPHFRMRVHEALAKWIARHDGAGRAAEILGELDAAGSVSATICCPSCARRLRGVSAELLARLGRVDDARCELAAWEAEYRGPDYPARRLLRARAQASIAMASASPEAAGALADLADAFEAAGKLEEAAWARLDLGRFLSPNHREKAIEALTSAAGLAERIGAMGLVRVAAQALRRLGVRAWRRGRAAGGDGLAALTSREQEVARLVAGGDSNGEIADALLVSPKTIERHITNVLTKLGLRNRTELAALVRSSSVRGSPDE